MADNPYLYENTVRVLDEAVYNWLGSFRVDYGNIAGVPRNAFPVLRVFASPYRAFADAADLLISQGWIAGDDPAVQAARAAHDWTVLPLPVISIERDDPIISDELANVAATWRNSQYDALKGEWLSHDYPLHYLTQYRFNFWCNSQYTRALFVEWIMGQIGRRGAWQNELYLTINHPEPWGQQLHQMRYTGSANLSDLEGDDARHIRQLYSFILRSWAFRKPDSTPNIYAIQQDFHDTTESGQVDVKNDADRWATGNLCDLVKFPPVAGGMAAVTVPSRLSVEAHVALPSDSALLARAVAQPDAFGRSVWFASGDSTSQGPWTLSMVGHDGEESFALDHVVIPQGVQKFHEFFIARAPHVGFGLYGNNVDTIVSLSNLDMRQVFETVRLSPTGLAANGGNIDYFFTGLTSTSFYLAVASFVTDQGITFNGVAEIADDSVAPNNVRQRAISYPECDGVVLVTMPRAGSIRLSLPADVKVDAVYLMPFNGYMKERTV